MTTWFCAMCKHNFRANKPVQDQEWYCPSCRNKMLDDNARTVSIKPYFMLPPAPDVDEFLRDYNKGRVVAKPEGLNVESCFEVFEAGNGYLARMKDGTVVVGKTMSECCEAAQSAAATVKIRGDAEQGSMDPTAKMAALGMGYKIGAAAIGAYKTQVQIYKAKTQADAARKAALPWIDGGDA